MFCSEVVAQLVRQDTQLNDLKKMCDELQRDEKQTEMKIKKKRQDLDRLNKQLSRLVSVPTTGERGTSKPLALPSAQRLLRALVYIQDTSSSD